MEKMEKMENNSSLIGMYSTTDENFDIGIRIVKLFNDSLYHSPCMKISREMVQDLKMTINIDLETILYRESLFLYKDEQYSKMTISDIKIANESIPYLIKYLRNLKIDTIFS